jgi:chromate reductase
MARDLLLVERAETESGVTQSTGFTPSLHEGRQQTVRILGLSGSLRSGASNTALLEAAALLAPPWMHVELYRGMAELPAFNPDQDTGDASLLPSIVADLRAIVGRADAILISSPEYAHGIPGSFKNLLDWLVGSVEFPGKATALISASSRSVHVKAQLTEVLATMSARLVDDACITIDMAGQRLDASGIVERPEMATALRDAVVALARQAR